MSGCFPFKQFHKTASLPKNRTDSTWRYLEAVPEGKRTGPCGAGFVQAFTDGGGRPYVKEQVAILAVPPGEHGSRSDPSPRLSIALAQTCSNSAPRPAAGTSDKSALWYANGSRKRHRCHHMRQRNRPAILMHLCTFFLMKSYGQRCIRMPPLRGGQILGTSLPHGDHKSAAARRINRPGPGRSVVRVHDAHRSVAKARASRSLRHRSIVSRRRPEGFALAPRAARCSLRSHSPLLTWRRLHRVCVGPCRSSEISTGSAGSRFARHAGRNAGAFLWSVHVPGTSRWRCRSRTNSLAALASFVEVHSVDPKNCARRSPAVGDDMLGRPGGCDDAEPARRAIAAHRTITPQAPFP